MTCKTRLMAVSFVLCVVASPVSVGDGVRVAPIHSLVVFQGIIQPGQTDVYGSDPCIQPFAVSVSVLLVMERTNPTDKLLLTVYHKEGGSETLATGDTVPVAKGRTFEIYAGCPLFKVESLDTNGPALYSVVACTRLFVDVPCLTELLPV